MRKSELMTLWNVESWSEEPYGVYFVSRRLGINRLENVGKAFEKLNISCTGYDVGESPAGHLYVLVSFDENFTVQQDVIYETL